MQGMDCGIESVDHFGLVAALCHDCDLVEHINKRVQSSQTQRNVSVGHAVMAMIINGLGYSKRRLYLSSQFYQNKPIDKLLQTTDISAEDLTEHALSTALDAIADYDETKLFSEITQEIALSKGLLSGACRIDTTSISTDGNYNIDEGLGAVNIRHGYSKDHRPDLNQVVLSNTVNSF